MTPELTAEAGHGNDIRPTVAAARGGRGPWLFGAGLVVAGLLLFHTLNSRREALNAPAITAPREREDGFVSSPPPLDVPPSYIYASARPWPLAGARYATIPSQAAQAVASTRPGGTRAVSPPATSSPYARSHDDQPSPGGFPPVPSAPSNPAETAPEDPRALPAGGTGEGNDRATATRFLNPGTTVPKGSVMQAVLESALDSTRSGFARAIVSRDVFSFDGSRVLVPRGSRLIGEYKADLALGQSRLLVQWQRLMRPDGAIINIDSPAADTLGRAGVRGRVNTHFFQRFAGAILQSALDIGVQLATREVGNDTVIIGLPGSTQGMVTTPERIQPTLTIRQGTSVSVFVARDLDFTAVDQ